MDFFVLKRSFSCLPIDEITASPIDEDSRNSSTFGSRAASVKADDDTTKHSEGGLEEKHKHAKQYHSKADLQRKKV